MEARNPELAAWPRRLTTPAFHAVCEAGAVPDAGRAALLDGRIVPAAPLSSARIGCIQRLNWLLGFALTAAERPDLAVRTESSVVLGPATELRPDVVLARISPDADDPDAPAMPGRIALAVFIAEAGGAEGAALYAARCGRAGVPETWVVDLSAGVVEVHTGTGSGGYAPRKRLGRGSLLPLDMLPMLDPIPVDEILGLETA